MGCYSVAEDACFYDESMAFLLGPDLPEQYTVASFNMFSVTTALLRLLDWESAGAKRSSMQGPGLGFSIGALTAF